MGIEMSRMKNIARRVEELTGTAHGTTRKKVKCLKCGTHFLSRARRICDECHTKIARMGTRANGYVFN